ncbi:MMPL family transporter [Maritimibacter sp. DP07]|uniref:MMPL family transporter n=1 Tax=Maritimibacter harenae TaxID=2606218 RepID=A0A845M6Y9_9RHOB|nr:MMPL family transporter [Maritimibacter harenae]MZR12244.1 MMPL family transporter [Maritimibacter harenae]
MRRPTSFARAQVRVLGAIRRRLAWFWLVLAALVLVAATGIPRVTFDTALIRFFEGDVAAFRTYDDVTNRFEGDANDVVVLLEAGSLADPAALEAVSSFLLEAQFIDGVRAVWSPLSFEITGPEGVREPLVPFPIPDAETMSARIDAVRAETPALRRLMSEGKDAMLAVLPITGNEAGQEATLKALTDLAARVSGDAVSVRVAGYPALRARVSEGLMTDVIALNLAGALIGFAVAALALRSVRLGLLTLPGPLIALMLSIGLFGHAGLAITTVTLTLPVLAMILATIDSIHILFERLHQGARTPRAAALRAVRRMAPACLAATVTTALAFAVFAASPVEVIAELGRMGAVILVVSTLTVMLTQSLVLSVAGARPSIRTAFARLNARPPRGGPFARLPRLALARPRLVTLGALGLLVLGAGLYGQAGPRYSPLDSLGPADPLRATFERIETAVAPISMMQVAVTDATPEVLAEVERTIAEASGSALVQSIASITGEAADARDTLPEAILARLVSADESRALVTLPFHYDSGAGAIALADNIDAALAGNPALAAVEISPVTGLPVMAARVVGGVLSDLQTGLLIAVAAVGGLIALWARSVVVALVALVPNVLPVALIGGGLALSGQGIGLAGGLALTVAFGVAVDDTLHVLNRIRLGGGFRGLDRPRLGAAMSEATPALVTTSALLVLGFGGSAFAATQEVAAFGATATGIFVLALLSDLLVLPAVVAFLGPRFYRASPKG